ncbi:hypothetical protein N8I82_00930 [Granulicatella adiacens]|uniref:hypothetical protein n=1 Tax=Granulicatella adiacens TaxID=46124 RepID=UPI0021D948CA|nr:hypothetical protein [Granulicatella adiacens]UXY41606.1 hypothetical protein N8I82_00930 [Granulicatella adiacens]
MVKFRKWTVKNVDQKKQYKTAMGTTDYDIPMFGYKSVLLIIASIVLSMFVIPAICDLVHIDFKWPFVICGGLVAGFAVSFSQFFVNSKKGITQAFWWVGGIWSIVIGIIYYFIVMTGVIL